MLAVHRAFPGNVVQAEPDITLGERAGALQEVEGAQANASSLYRALRQAGYAHEETPDRIRA